MIRKPIDLMVLNARILTLDAAGTVAEALAVRDGRIAAVGATHDVVPLAGPGTTVLDARGRTVLPGFIEPHNHMVMAATARLGVDVRTPPNRTLGDLIDRLRERADATPPGHWILGRGYDDTGLADMRHPTRRDLDRASTAHPIVIWHNSGHLAVANSAALALAGVHSGTEDPAGGRLGREAGTAELDGILYELPAQLLVTRLIPAYTESALRAAFLATQEEYLRRGVTSIHDALAGRLRGVDIVETYRRLGQDGALRLRVSLYIAWEHLRAIDFALAPGEGDGWVRVAGCKIIADGSIQGITAALREPYHCDHNEKGWLIHEQGELDEMVLTLHRRGYQIATHANGDAAIDAVLASYARALRIAPRADHRHRIEHCQVCHPEHIARMATLGVIPDFFANHVYYWGDRHRDRFLGPARVRSLDPVGSAVQAGLRPLLHSDCPVTPVGPLFCVQSAVARTTSSGKLLTPEERVSVADALAGVTTNAARAGFEERDKGRLEVGMLADLVVLDRDPFACDPREIGTIETAATVVGGRVMHRTD